jgi:hypothetical protein
MKYFIVCRACDKKRANALYITGRWLASEASFMFFLNQGVLYVDSCGSAV